MANRTLADVCEIVMGQSPAKETCNTSGVGLPLLNGPTEYGTHHPTPVQFTTNPRKCAKEGDILFCVRGSVGRMNWADRDYAIGRGIAAIRHKSQRELQPLVRAVIEYNLPNLLIQATGSVFPNVSLGQLSSLPWPNLDERHERAIAHILSTLDDKIELNRRMSETLEAMVRALFKAWFVDFEPVRAKMEGRWQRGQSLPGLPADLYDLFPDRLVESELGEIPEGWEVGALDQLVDFVLGGDWGSDEQDAQMSEAVHCIRGADIPDLQIGRTGKIPIRYLKPSSLAKRQLKDGDLVIEISGGSPTQSTGRAILISHELLAQFDLPLVCSNFCRLVRLKSPAFSKFVYLWLQLLYDKNELLQFETGTTGIKNFAFKLFSTTFKFCIPPVNVLEAFYRLFDRLVPPFFKYYQANAAVLDTLAQLRDALLPKLISGKLRVKDAKAFLKERGL